MLSGHTCFQIGGDFNCNDQATRFRANVFHAKDQENVPITVFFMSKIAKKGSNSARSMKSTFRGGHCLAV